MFTPKTVAELLSTTVAHVRDLIRSKKLRAINIGMGRKARWRIPVDALEEFTSGRAPMATVPTRKRRTSNPEVIEFYPTTK
jgi:excisionase family DNA binding protein